MKVGFYLVDHHPHVGGGYTFLNTIKDELSNTKDIEIVLITRRPNKKIKYELKSVYIHDSTLLYLFFRIIRKIFSLIKITRNLEKRIISKVIKKEKIDILWIPGPYEFDSPVPYIFTPLDIGHRVIPYFPEVSIKGEWESRERVYNKMLFKASYIIAGNQTGKKEILENYPMNPEKIRVVPFPTPIKTNTLYDYTPLINIEKPYIFYPAQFWPHKNHISLIETVRYLNENNYQIHCYFTGSDMGNMVYIKNTIKEYNLEKYIHVMGFVDDDMLVYLYKNALALTYVSLLGPNNLPPIEAVSLGCPVIVSNIPGHIEQMGDAALAVDATDPVEIGNAVIKLLSDSEFRGSLIIKGNVLAEKQREYSYFAEMITILSDFKKIRKTWA